MRLLGYVSHALLVSRGLGKPIALAQHQPSVVSADIEVQVFPHMLGPIEEDFLLMEQGEVQ